MARLHAHRHTEQRSDRVNEVYRARMWVPLQQAPFGRVTTLRRNGGERLAGQTPPAVISDGTVADRNVIGPLTFARRMLTGVGGRRDVNVLRRPTGRG